MRRQRPGGLRETAGFLALALGALMVLAGIYSLFAATPHPEITTGGAALMIASGLIGKNGKE